MATLIFWGLVTWLVVAPDKVSHTVTRGLWGATRSWFDPDYAAAQAKAGKRKAGRSGAAQGSRWDTVRAGWRTGVQAARQKRANGKDVWSWSCWVATHGARVAGRAWGGTQNIRAGVRRIPADISAWRAKRKSGPTVEGEVIDDEPTGSSHGRADDEMDIVEGEVIDDDTADITDSQDGDPKRADLVETPEGEAPPAEGAGGASTTTTTPAQAGKEHLMSINTTELDSLDAVEAEVVKAEQMCAALAETFEAAKEWGHGLDDRWAGADWGTEDLNAAVAEIPDAVAALGDVEPLLAALSQVKAAVEKGRTFGDHVQAAAAYGDVSKFQAA